MESNVIESDELVVNRTAIARDWRLFNVIMLGVSFLFLFTAFNTCSMVQTLVLEGVGNETNAGNGYTSLSIVYGVFAVSNWIAPPIVAVIGMKWSMFIASCLYCLFMGSFIRPMAVTLYICSALVGLGAAVIWTAQGGFLTANSTPDTIQRNTGIFWALFQGGLLFGNLFVYFKLKGETIITDSTRIVLFIVLTSVGAVGALLMLSFRKPPENDKAEVDALVGVPSQSQNIWNAFKKSFLLVSRVEMLLLFIFFAYTGFSQSFWGAVYITSVGHIGQFGSMAKQLTGLCGMFVGVGEIVGGLAFGILNNHIGRPSKSTVVLLGLVVHVATYFVIFITFPSDSPLSETDAYSYFHASPYVAVVCAFLLGLGDSSFNTQLYPIIRQIFPDDCTQAFALSKFIQSLASTATFVYSQHLVLEWQLLILILFSFFGSILFFVAEYIANKRDTTGYLLIPTRD